ncbi:hypothetical protein NP493_1492g00010 [Ridgeia piscesae]|uniref:Peptidyl-prolyl cis-trans isomerase n=1 Tax=Ridgeia piscesae TaxID=27915 RepID=A0AAD9K2Z7_RIDPI|nr:hypothetical protein NP493_1492g00010 [Ridgeia piscesae]
MSTQLFLASLAAIVSLAHCGNFTVTDEAWFEVEIKDMDGPGQDYRGRFVIALFGEVAPMTVMNFVAITKGYKSAKSKLHYKNTRVHRIVRDFLIQMGDIVVGDGTGSKSIYGERFNDEEFILSHRHPGWVSMANHGKDSNGSQFFILLSKARWLDGKHVVFGKVVRGFDVIETINEVPVVDNTATPAKRIKITDCGMNDLERSYDLTEEQMASTEDL